MLPDLRFVMGAVLATTLLGVTLFGFAAAMHISHQSKISPLEASRMLAYTPESRIFDVPGPRFDSPFANIPADPNPVPWQQPAAAAPPPVQTAAAAPPSVPAVQPMPVVELTAEPAPSREATPAAEPIPEAQPANLPLAADDPDTVDERAVVDPPLPLDPEPQAEPSPSVAAPAEPAPTVVTAPAESAATALPAPIETSPAVAAPVAEEPAVTPDVQQVGSLPTSIVAPEIRSDVSAVASTADAQETVKARRRRAIAKAKPKPKPKPRRTAQRAPVQRAPAQVDAFGQPAGTTSAARRPAQGFWGPFN